MNEKKLVIIVSSPFYLNDYDRFGIDNFLEKGFEINICNVGPIIYPDFYKNAEEALSKLCDAEDRLQTIDNYFGEGIHNYFSDSTTTT